MFSGSICVPFINSHLDENLRTLVDNCCCAFLKLPFAAVLQNRCFKKFRKFQRKTPVLEFLSNTFVLESLFNKVAGLGMQLYQKETPTLVFSYEIYEFFKNT